MTDSLTPLAKLNVVIESLYVYPNFTRLPGLITLNYSQVKRKLNPDINPISLIHLKSFTSLIEYLLKVD